MDARSAIRKTALIFPIAPEPTYYPIDVLTDTLAAGSDRRG